MTADPLALSVRGLRKSFPDPEGGRVEVLRVDHLDLEPGRTLAVIGESGSGKTTLLHVVAGIHPADAGTVLVAGRPMTGLGETARDRLRAEHVGYLFQTFNLLSHLTALENVTLGMTFRPRVGESPRRRAREALDRVGLSDRLAYRPSQLSVGQQQRVAIARALAGRPNLVLADEPTANLDAVRAEESLDLLLTFAEECKAAVLAVTHDDRALLRFPNRLTLEARV
jgi:putative ABC transport system ATP-binding protein